MFSRLLRKRCRISTFTCIVLSYYLGIGKTSVERGISLLTTYNLYPLLQAFNIYFIWSREQMPLVSPFCEGYPLLAVNS